MHFSNCDVLEWFYDFALLSIVLSLKKTSSIWASRACNPGQFQKRSFTFGYWPLVTLTRSLVVVGRHRLARHTFVWVQPVAWQPPILKITNGQTPFNSSPPTVWINLGASSTGWRSFTFCIYFNLSERKIHTHIHTQEPKNKQIPQHTHTQKQLFFLSLEKPDDTSHTCLLFVIQIFGSIFSLFFFLQKNCHMAILHGELGMSDMCWCLYV